MLLWFLWNATLKSKYKTCAETHFNFWTSARFLLNDVWSDAWDGFGLIQCLPSPPHTFRVTLLNPPPKPVNEANDEQFIARISYSTRSFLVTFLSHSESVMSNVIIIIIVGELISLPHYYPHSTEQDGSPVHVCMRKGEIFNQRAIKYQFIWSCVCAVSFSTPADKYLKVVLLFAWPGSFAVFRKKKWNKT